MKKIILVLVLITTFIMGCGPNYDEAIQQCSSYAYSRAAECKCLHDLSISTMNSRLQIMEAAYNCALLLKATDFQVQAEGDIKK